MLQIKKESKHENNKELLEAGVHFGHLKKSGIQNVSICIYGKK